MGTKKSTVSSCLKQCETVYPKKKAGCRQKCYDKNFTERPNKNQNHKKLHPSKNPCRKKPKTVTPVNEQFFSSCLKQCETVHVKKRRDCRKKCHDKNVTESPKKNKNDKKSNPTKKSLNKKGSKKVLKKKGKIKNDEDRKKTTNKKKKN